MPLPEPSTVHPLRHDQVEAAILDLDERLRRLALVVLAQQKIIDAIVRHLTGQEG